MTTLWRNAHLATMAGPDPWGWIEHGAMLVDGEALQWVGAEADLPALLKNQIMAEHDLAGAFIYGVIGRIEPNRVRPGKGGESR